MSDPVILLLEDYSKGIIGTVLCKDVYWCIIYAEKRGKKSKLGNDDVFQQWMMIVPWNSYVVKYYVINKKWSIGRNCYDFGNYSQCKM